VVKNYFLSTWRNMWKSKVYTAINIVGLAIGVAACIVIMVFVFYEKNFDKIHKKNIYRLDEVQKFEGMVAPQNVALSMYPMGPTMKNEFKEILNFTRINASNKVRMGVDGQIHFLDQSLWVDSTFLQLFDFDLLEGDRNTALEKPNSMVVTEETAKRLFGKSDAMGKTLNRYGNDTLPFTITGIVKNVPGNSHLQFDALFAFNTIAGPNNMNNWGGNWLVTYFELVPEVDLASLSRKFPDFLKRHMNGDNWKFYELFLQPLNEVHSKSSHITHDYINHQKFDQKHTYIFFIIALIVLLIACINFMNLSTARSAGRAKEVGVRKSIGARKGQLAIQFLTESVMISMLALVLAIGMALIFLPAAAKLSLRELKLPLFSNGWLGLSLLAGALILGLFAGLYPAIYLSSFEPASILKGSFQGGKNKSGFRNLLVVSQFTGAVFLIITTLFAIKQLRFMQQKDPGFERDQVLVIPLNNTANQNYDPIKKELLNQSFITGVSASQQRLGNNLHQTGVIYHGEGPMRELTSSQIIVDPDYLNLYQIDLVAGNNFRNEPSANATEYIVNESLARELLKDKPGTSVEKVIGKMFGFGGMDSTGRIVGVARDFNFNSFHHKIETLCMFNQKEWGFGEMSVKINGRQTTEALNHIQNTWARMVPDMPLEYKFLDEHFNELYRSDNQVSRIVGALAILAIVIACLGLFGLATYAAEQRIKEIGIRKVLGAGVFSVVSLLSWNFIKLILMSNALAWLIAWLSLNNWLQGFAYRVDLNWWVFLLAGLSSVLISLMTISFQAFRAAIANPVISLRSE